MTGHSDRREHLRRRVSRGGIVAYVQRTDAQESFAMRLRDASLGGLFLRGTSERHRTLASGADLDVVLVPNDPPDAEAILLRGRVVRVDDPERVPGFGVLITGIDDENRGRYGALLGRVG